MLHPGATSLHTRPLRSSLLATMFALYFAAPKSGPLRAPNCASILQQQLISVPAKRPTRLILNHSRLEEVLLLLEIDELAHPRERVGRTREQLV